MFEKKTESRKKEEKIIREIFKKKSDRNLKKLKQPCL